MKVQLTILSTIFFLLSLGASAAEIPFKQCERPYADTYCQDKYLEAINFLRQNNIVSGYEDGSFKPNQTLNRAELLKIIAEGSALYYEQDPRQFEAYSEESCFADVPAGQWFTKYVCYAKAEGWIQGYKDNTFRPSQTVNFVEALKMTLQGFQIDYDPGSTPWYRSAINTASAANSIPFSISAFDQNLTRAEMADLITRVIKASNNQLESYLGDRADKIVTYSTIEQGLDLSQAAVSLKAQEAQTPKEDLADLEKVLDIWLSGSWPYKLTDNVIKSYQGRLDFLAEQEVKKADVERIQLKINKLADQVPS